MPSLAVDLNSWARPACYPRGSFYPVSYDHSTPHRRITKPDFRLCSTSTSRSQAGFCLYTLRWVPIPSEPTFGRLRYPFGGDRPSQTAHLPLSLTRIHTPRLEPNNCQAGISTSTPRTLTNTLPRLPAILHKQLPNAMTSCSKAPRGLFVLLRVIRIFTHTSISPGPLLRQCSTRYAFRAGRNLPDKELRYLRTVIVTAAVHRGFISMLAHFHLTFRHWAGVSPYTSACAFAETCVFGKQSAEPFHCNLTEARRSFSRSYGSILPSSLAEVLPLAFVFSTRPPVSVCGTDGKTQQARSFSRPLVADTSCLAARPRGISPLATSIHSEADLTKSHLAPSSYRYGNINPLSIAYASQPRLRTD